MEQILSRNNIIVPIGTHGFYLPTIKVWNIFAEAIRKDMKENFSFNGSIEDYVIDGGKNNCHSCGDEMKRTLLEANKYFNGASIFCSNSMDSSHPKEYWVEVWPDASSKLSCIEYYKISTSERTENKFKLSNKIIKSCWDGRLNGFLYHMKCIADEDFPGEDNTDILPKEEYRHS